VDKAHGNSEGVYSKGVITYDAMVEKFIIQQWAVKLKGCLLVMRKHFTSDITTKRLT